MRTTSLSRVMTSAALAATFLIAGCGKDTPVAPEMKEPAPPPVVEIKTPRKMRINSLLVWTVPFVDADGKKWDNDPFNSDNENPDIYCALGNYKTGTINNYDGGHVNLKWTGSKGYGQMNYAGSYSLKLYDKDDGFLQGGDDHMTTATIKPSALYRQDNATRFTIRLEGRDFTVWAYGEWIY